VDRLKENLGKARAQFDEWAENHLRSLESSREEFFVKSSGMKAELLEMEKQEKMYVEQGEALAQLMDSERQEIESINAGIEQLRKKQSELPLARDALQNRIVRDRERLKQLDSVTQTNRDASSEHKLKLKQVSNMYQNALGLKFDSTPLGLRFIFTHIDPKNALRECTFTLGINEQDDSYFVSCCEPAVEKMPLLLTQLNANPDQLGIFVSQVRYQFQIVLCSSPLA